MFTHCKSKQLRKSESKTKEQDLRTLNSTIKPGTRTAHLLNVNQNERASQKEKQVWV